MKETFRFKLTQKAKSTGGDRYEYGTKGDKLFMVQYVPQILSRQGGDQPVAIMKITFESEDV